MTEDAAVIVPSVAVLLAGSVPYLSQRFAERRSSKRKALEEAVREAAAAAQYALESGDNTVSLELQMAVARAISLVRIYGSNDADQACRRYLEAFEDPFGESEDEGVAKIAGAYIDFVNAVQADLRVPANRRRQPVPRPTQLADERMAVAGEENKQTEPDHRAIHQQP